MSMKSIAAKMGIGPTRKKTTPVVKDQFATARKSVTFTKAQGMWDEAQRMVSQAKNERELDKALSLMYKAQKVFDAAFKAHQQ
jgi:hypothetical protein